MKTNISKVTVIALSVLLLCSAFAVTAFAGYAESLKMIIQTFGYEYNNYCSINTATGANNVSGVTYIDTTNYKSVPSGYMGACARIYDQSNDLLLSSSSFSYNSGALSGHSARTYCNGIAGKSYYSYGQTQTFNGNGYNSQSTYRSPAQTY